MSAEAQGANAGEISITFHRTIVATVRFRPAMTRFSLFYDRLFIRIPCISLYGDAGQDSSAAIQPFASHTEPADGF